MRKFYAIKSDHYYNDGRLGRKLFKTKKEIHIYMKKLYNCGFQYNKEYEYYYNTKEEIWYKPILMEVVDDV